MAQEDETLSQDTLFEILSNPRRRHAIYLLRVEEGPVVVTELAERIAAHENETTVDALTRQQRKRVYVSLYQTHVPKLEDAGIVTYDRDAGEVELAAASTEVDRYLGEETDDLSWTFLYLPLALVGTGLVTLRTGDVWLFGDLSGSTVALVVGFGLLITVAAHAIVRWKVEAKGEAVPELKR